MSPKVEDGLNWVESKDYFLLKLPIIGGWALTKSLSTFYHTLEDKNGWGWDDYTERVHEGAALVAPLPILLWEKE